ncbi:SDR family oxidoreductase [Evansella clarkii]|uniref:SDR family oxidoreductase n=1 Tax=Evansella clarkii TaxID=79879 RepID=UPI000B432AED|nr:SDR family NAD(P)-dependent oxidoreductase [Evansella clarkii]
MEDNYLNLRGKTAIITGGSSGIGRGTALKLAEQGVRLGLIDIKHDRGEEVVQQIEEKGSEAVLAEADISDPGDTERAIKEIADKFGGKIDIVFANAGMNGVLVPIEDMEPEDWHHTISTNLNGTFYTVKYAIPYMKKSGGSIIITSSVNGSRIYNNFGFSAYSSSKGGINAFAKMAALELANYAIRVNTICPGAVKTKIGEEGTERSEAVEKIEIPVEYPEGNQPLDHRPGQPEEVANLVLFLSSEASHHITGTEIFIDGAESLL